MPLPGDTRLPSRARPRPFLPGNWAPAGPQLPLPAMSTSAGHNSMKLLGSVTTHHVTSRSPSLSFHLMVLTSTVITANIYPDRVQASPPNTPQFILSSAEILHQLTARPSSRLKVRASSPRSSPDKEGTGGRCPQALPVPGPLSNNQ